MGANHKIKERRILFSREGCANPRHPSGCGGNGENMNEKPIRVRYDYATEKWFKKHPMHQTTVMQCEVCGLYYKPSLGHRCKKIMKAKE